MIIANLLYWWTFSSEKP